MNTARTRKQMTWQIESEQDRDTALIPATLNTRPGSAYAYRNRQWQGIPGLERTRQGRLFATWYSGGEGEGSDNYVLLVTSEDDGQTWSEPQLVIDNPGRVRAYDPGLWIDPRGRLWLFWAQSYEFYDGRAGVWAIRCDDPDAAELGWREPQRIANGVMMNKPTVLSTGEWCWPTAVWDYCEPLLPDLAAERFSNLSVSRDEGASWTLWPGPDVPNRQFDEHMLVERRDGSLWMLVRTHSDIGDTGDTGGIGRTGGIGESVSTDRGRTWSPGRDAGLGGPGSRFFIRRLRSGRLLLVNHYNFSGRNNLTAMLSDDDGATWSSHLLLDERDKVAYPDGVQAEDGTIYVIYDRDRYGVKGIHMAIFTEADVAAGRIVSAQGRLKQVISGDADG